MKKQYVIAPYKIKANVETVLAMYEADDERLQKYKDIEIVKGTFERTKSVKGMQNGFEIGIFHGNRGRDFLVFTDHTARIIAE